MQNVANTYRVSISDWENIRGSINNINKKVKQIFKGIKKNYIKEVYPREYQVHHIVDLAKMLSVSKVLDTHYKIVEKNIQQFIDHSYGVHVTFENHVLTRIDYKFDAEVKKHRERELIFHLIYKHTQLIRYKQKIRWGIDDC